MEKICIFMYVIRMTTHVQIRRKIGSCIVTKMETRTRTCTDCCTCTCSAYCMAFYYYLPPCFTINFLSVTPGFLVTYNLLLYVSNCAPLSSKCSNLFYYLNYIIFQFTRFSRNSFLPPLSVESCSLLFLEL